MSRSTTNFSLPKAADVLIIGGGPAGSYAASVLAQEGLCVVLCEASKFPRYHIGESLLPSVRNYLRFIGAEKKVIDHGFTHKPGGAIKFNHHKREACMCYFVICDANPKSAVDTDFVAIGQENSSWNVVRSEFDELLLNHARESGTSVFEQTRITSLSFAEDDPSRPVSAAWEGPEGTSGSIQFKYLLDASGRAGVMSTKYLKNRHFNQSLKNIAVWGYWKNVGSYGLGTPRAGAPYFEALKDESGWAWFIPINNGTTSVGLVRNQEMHVEQLRCPISGEIPFDDAAVPNPSQSRMVDQYAFNLSLAPGIVRLITEDGKLEAGSVKSATDFSYSASLYAGNGYRIAGDAGAFIDPFFSSGVHLALTSALSAATSICASIRGDCTEDEAAAWHTRRFSTSYTRFQVVVLSAYKQLRSQDIDILSDIDEDNYDRAFGFLRPIIQGNGDMGVRLHGRELADCMEFCAKLFNPTNPEDHERLRKDKNFNQALLDLSAPIAQLSSFTPESPEAKEVLEKVNSRRVLNGEYTTDSFVSEAIGGYNVRLEKGSLGLRHT
ncbi:hypothetical protein VNI00_007498 [Paramarasmius palmivorus]|uniref:FAD-binding domain-containing protein n=1 Tax=Paramarasmius palmivorus TaxID=297713 RepID=A0AAW0D4H6_9AGAR